MRRMAVATVHLAGLGPNVPALVDPSDPQIARWIRGGMLRYVDDDPQVEVETLGPDDSNLLDGLPQGALGPSGAQAEVEAKPKRASGTRKVTP